MLEKNLIYEIQFLIDKIFSIWCEMKNNDMDKLQEIWMGLESDKYISKFMETEHYINKVISELENLQDMYKKYIIFEEKEENL